MPRFTAVLLFLLCGPALAARISKIATLLATEAEDSWAGPFSTDIDADRNIASSRQASLELCQAACVAEVENACIAIRYSAAAAAQNCFLFDDKEDTLSQNGDFEVFKLTRDGFPEPGPSGNAPVVLPHVPEKSRKWMEGLSRGDIDEYKRKVGKEIFDEGCTEYISDVLTSVVGDHSWWLKTFDEDPLVHGMIEPKSSKEIQEKWDKVNNAEFEAAPGLQVSSMNWFTKFCHNTFGRLSKMWRQSRSSKASNGGAAKKFKEKLAQIAREENDEDGKKATICSLDFGTLKLMPFSRGWHRSLMKHDEEYHGEGNAKCKGTEAPEESSRRSLGLMDVDRVMRATQMAIYQTCYFKCMRFVVHNFEKTAMGENKEGAQFCELSHEQQRMKVGSVDTFLNKLITDHESDRYEECQMLFSEDDSGAELVDYAIESVCSVYRRPTPMYFPSESPPLDLYMDRTIHNQPVCRPAGISADGRHAVQVGPGAGSNRSQTEPQRYCPEGTHCLCQRASRVDHVAAPSKKASSWKAFHVNHWFASDHCSALRPQGSGALLWVDPVKMRTSEWGKTMHDFRATNHGTRIGIGILVSGSVFGAYSLGFFATVGTWFTAVAGPMITGVIGPAIGTALTGAAAGIGGAVSVATAGIGPAVVCGLMGVTFIVRDQTFDCAHKIGCYPLKCEYDHATKNCGMTLNGGYPDEGPAMPMWWMPPPSMQCALAGRKWYTFYSRSRTCQLQACTPEEMAKNLVGHFQSPHSKSGNKFDLMNCQPVQMKDMNAFQQTQLLKTLSDTVRTIVAGRTRDNKELIKYLQTTHNIQVPECLTDLNCRLDQEGHPEELPFCHPVEKVCRKPLVTSMEIELETDNDGEWKDSVRKYMAHELFGRTDMASSIRIHEEMPDEVEAPAPVLAPREQVQDSGLGDEDDLSDEEDMEDLIGNFSEEYNSSLIEKSAAVAAAPKTKKFTMVVKEDTSTSHKLNVDNIWKKLRHLQDTDNGKSAKELGLSRLLGQSFKLNVVDIGTVCQKRAPVEHSSKVCGLTKSGFGCNLECQDGWVAHSTIKCESDGQWSDAAIEQGSLVPDKSTATFECRQVVCPRKELGAEFCPRAVSGCWSWKDSECNRGGLSGEQPYCELVPGPGYYLVSPHNKQWKCGTDKRWTSLEDFTADPEIAEWSCDGSVAKSLGMVDSDSGVTSICTTEKSGKKSEDDTNPGKCKVVCKQGLQEVKQDPLRCSTDGHWIGRARCEPITCSAEGLTSQNRDNTKVDITCLATVGVGVKAKDKCQITCSQKGHAVQSDDLYCSHEGTWKGSVVCQMRTAGMDRSQEGPENGAQHMAPLGLLACAAASLLAVAFV